MLNDQTSEDTVTQSFGSLAECSMSERILILTKESQCTAKAEYSQLVCVASFYLPKNEDDKSSYYFVNHFFMH